MTNDTPIHIQVTYTENATEVLATYAVSAEVLQQAELWRTGANNPSAKVFAGWLEKHGGKLDCGDGPAYIVRNATGWPAKYEAYYRSGTQHREDGPALIIVRKNGSTYEAYYHDGQLDRTDGPAIIKHESDGSLCEEYYRAGKFVKAECLPPLLSAIPGVFVQRSPPPVP